MGYIKENLSKNESITNDIKLSKLGLIGPIIWLLLFFPVGIYQLLTFKSTEQAITNRKVMKKTGIISRNIDEMRLNKIETVEFKQSILGRICNYGNVYITGTGGSAVVFNFVSNPRVTKNQIDELIDSDS